VKPSSSQADPLDDRGHSSSQFPVNKKRHPPVLPRAGVVFFGGLEIAPPLTANPITLKFSIIEQTIPPLLDFLRLSKG
jgi:hypothetical protein